MSISRTTTKCNTCRNNDGEYENVKCLECYHNPWMSDHYKEVEE